MKNDGATPVVEEEAAALENELAVEDAAKDEDAGAEDDTDVLNERGADFNEEDVVPSTDDDVCALKTVECIGASEGVQPSETFIKSLTTNGNILEEGRMQALKQWNDALSEQIKVSVCGRLDAIMAQLIFFVFSLFSKNRNVTKKTKRLKI